MKHFRLHRDHLDIQPILLEVSAHDNAWAEQTGRQRRVRVQAETNGIPLRGLRRSKIMGRRRRDVHETRYTSLAKHFPSTIALLERLAREISGHLGRAKLARLPPGACVQPHVDRGEYYEVRDRYHLVIASRGGSKLRAGSEEVSMRLGELWWFDNKAIHSASNESEHHRIHLIFDLEPTVASANEKTPTEPTPDPRRLLEAARSAPPLGPTEAIKKAVQLYLAIRLSPKRWEEVLREHRSVRLAESKPLGVLAELLWPELDLRRRMRRTSAIAWALAQLDLRRVEVDQLPCALCDAGGIRSVHRRWLSAKEEMLYGTD